MKKSKYNLFIKYDENNYIIFNSLYGTLGKLNNDIVNRYHNNKLNEEEINTLYNKKIFIADEVDEIDLINKDRISGIKDDSKKVYRIWTTSACNARCFYCFEKGMKAETMSEETAYNVAQYIIERIKPNDRIRIEWFGGEPLLNTNVIKIISDIVINKCNEVSAKYSSNIITNGSLIDKNICDLFKCCLIKKCQITLDGGFETYDDIKNYYNKSHNFFTVINNLKLLTNNEINVSLRLNYDNNNYEPLSMLLDFLNRHFRNNEYLKAYIYPLWSSTNTGVFVSEAHADNNYIKLIDKLVKYNFMKADNVIGLKRKVRQCAARNINSVAILPNGDFSKCSETFNQVIGNTYSGITDIKTYKEWISESLHDDCKDCLYLPLCNDGCKASNYNNMPTCFPTKDIIKDIIKWYVSYLDKQKE